MSVQAQLDEIDDRGAVDAESRCQATEPNLRADREFCRQLLPQVSRTFALSIELLPANLRDAVRVSYLLCRIVDTIEDDAKLLRPDREASFDQFDALLERDELDPAGFEARCRVQWDREPPSPDITLCLGAGSVLRCFRALDDGQKQAIRPPVLEMSRGMREYSARADQEGRLRLRDTADLERYCYYVAGTVGELLTALFEQSVPSIGEEALRQIRERSVSFGLGLQLVNIVKDVAADHERQDCFLPEDVATESGVQLADILDPLQRPLALQVVARVCARAREHLQRAREYTLLWPSAGGEHVRLFCAVPLMLALATLEEVEAGDDTLRPGRTPKISRAQVAQIIEQARRAVTSDDVLDCVIESYASRQAESAADCF
jgi:farnesyl-diphosphate farnesyltransferase